MQSGGRAASIAGDSNKRDARAGAGDGLGAIFFSLRDFAAAGLRPRTPLARAIMLVLVIKLIGVAGLQIYLLAGGAPPAVDAGAMARVIGVPPASQ